MGQSEARKVRRTPTDTLATYIPRLGATPLEFQPGSRWMYSPSDGIDVLARVVEIVSGTPMNVFLKQRIFDPLDMPETSHYPTDAQMPRLVTAYRNGRRGPGRDPELPLDVEQGLLRRRWRPGVHRRRLLALRADAGERGRIQRQAAAEPAHRAVDDLGARTRPRCLVAWRAKATA